MVFKTTIDGSGRLVIPKAIRDQLRLRTGRTLEIRTDGDRVILEPLAEKTFLAERNGVLVITSDLHCGTADYRQDREDRLMKLGGIAG